MKLGFIGCGNMASAIIGGILKNGLCAPADVLASDLSEEACKKAEAAFSIATTSENVQACRHADVLFLAVKPQFYADVIAQIRSEITPQTLVITIAPGKTLAWLAEQFQKPVPIVRTMPNTPALVGEGMTAMCANELVSDEAFALAKQLLSSFGKVEVIPERLMDAVVSVSGSSPAYVFMLLEAMADAAVADGMPRAQAYLFAGQAVLGSAKMLLETGKHPGELKDMVCSPAGTTIEAVRVLEKEGFRSSVMEAMRACIEKAKSM